MVGCCIRVVLRKIDKASATVKWLALYFTTSHTHVQYKYSLFVEFSNGCCDLHNTEHMTSLEKPREASKNTTQKTAWHGASSLERFT